MMKRLIIYLTLVLLVFSQEAKEGTQGYYISPHGISRQREVHDALPEVLQKIKVVKTTYGHDDKNYTIDNVTIQMGFNDAKQAIEIEGIDQVKVFGGKFQFLYNFNWTKNEGGKQVSGYGYGSVMSDGLTYTKQLDFNSEGHLFWMLSKYEERRFTNLTITNKMTIKRLQPFSELDLDTLQIILDGALKVEPTNVKHQILQPFNEYMPEILNTTLNHESMGRQYNYTYRSPTKGQLTLTIEHKLYDFAIDADDGYKVRYDTKIKGDEDPACKGVTLPEKHKPFQLYGGTQNIHLNCFYEHVILHLHKIGWLDTKLNTDWDSNAFQFYAGDLFDLISNLYMKVSPRQLLDGQCAAQADGLSFVPSRQYTHNTFTLSVNYKCVIRSKDTTRKQIDVAKWTSDVRFYIELEADKTTLSFKMIEADTINMTFEPVGDFFVNNRQLALFKANEMMKKLANSQVFGSGYSSIPLSHPKTLVDTDYTLFYDDSHIKIETE